MVNPERETRNSEPRGGPRRAVFLDRDGVLTEATIREGRAYAPLTLEDFRLVEGAAGQVARLRQAGLVPIVFTNQPEVARGLLAPQILAEMHGRLRDAIPVEDVLVCSHDSHDGCACHKPKPGMLQAAAGRWNLDLQGSFVIGDRWRDIDAGRAAGCYTVLIERPYSQCPSPDARVATLEEAVDLILSRVGGRFPSGPAPDVPGEWKA
jgi:D-glycero-D-manno-heptose 1,7-bisphosphate phosphatase